MDSPLISSIERLGIDVPNIRRSINAAEETKAQVEAVLRTTFPQWASLDTTVVVFGSLAREEWTSQSDLDWTYLIDGQANSDHLTIAQAIKRELEDKFREPSPHGAFASLVFSHELVHKIGGQDDTNRNTTQRMLLLLESVAIGSKAQEAYERVVRAVIGRYLEEDAHLLTSNGQKYKVPRFLLNDIVRFWRMMAVDFASKQRDRGGKGWGLRNLKLRMSRKLLFASGLLTCFGCHFDPAAAPVLGASPGELQADLIGYLRKQFRLTPLDVFANGATLYEIPEVATKLLFKSYDEFLGMLQDDVLRKHLDDLRAENADRDRVFGEVRRISRDFQNALDAFFSKTLKLAL